MKILAVYPGHNATVGYFEDGRCHFLVHEEKFSNYKNHLGFPKQSLTWLAGHAKLDAVDCVVFPSRWWHYWASPAWRTPYWEESQTSVGLRSVFTWAEYHVPHAKRLLTGFRNWVVGNRITPQVMRSIGKWFWETYRISPEKFIRLDHHETHAYTPIGFYGNCLHADSPMLIMTMDGAGDHSFAKVFEWNADRRTLQMISDSPFTASLGGMFEAMTAFLGMKAGEHEYKVMGLAAYVTEEKYYRRALEKLRSLIWLDEETLTFHSRFNIHVSSRYLREHLVFERFDNLAAAVQKRLEELVLAWVRAAVRKTGIRRFAFSGGVFMNVKMNQHILELPEVDAAWFQPAAGDESLVIGASTAMHLQQGMTPVPVETMNLGVRYTSEDVESFLRSHDMYARFKVERKPNMEDTIAELLAQFKVVARFKGAGEWGARSLGQRSILANGSDLKSFYMVNDMIKMRDFWMPFAPTILAEWAPRYIKNWDVLSSKVFDSSKYMILTFDSTPLAQHHLRAAIHQKDKTLRPQVLEEKDNPDLYRLLKYYEARTGMGGFLNTSFNLHGYPLVGTLEQALFTFENSGLEYLAIEDWLIAKQG